MIAGPIPWKGLSTSDIPATLPPGMSTTLTDFNVIRGTLNTRRNIRHVYDWGSGNFSDVFYWEDPANYPGLSQAAILVMPYHSFSANKIYTAPWDEGFTLVPTDATGTASVFYTGFSGTSDSLNGVFVLAGYTTSPVCITAYNGTFAALGGSPPQSKFNKTVNNFMFLSGNTTNQSRVYWSNVIDPTTWGAANYVDFRKSDGDIVSAIWSLNNDLLIFKRRSLGKLSTTPPSTAVSVTLGPLTTISENIGCMGFRAVDSLPDGTVVFLGADLNLYQFDGVVIKNLSKQPYPGPDAGLVIGPSFDILNSKPIVKYYPPLKAILVVVIASSTSQSTYMYFLDDNAWSQYSGQTISGLCMAGPTRPNAFGTYNASPTHRIMYTSNYPQTGGSHGCVNVFDGGNGGTVGPTDDTETAIFAVAETTFSPNPDQYEFVPRSLVFTVSNLILQLKVKFGWDGVMNSYYSFDGSSNVTPGGYRRIVVPIPLPMSTGSAGSGGPLPLQVPWILTIRIEASGDDQYQYNNRANISPLYLSDEILSGSTSRIA
jgi:hypothetical protein